jgi:DNA repair exonuclease SbcCD ATPase subunit
MAVFRDTIKVAKKALKSEGALSLAVDKIGGLLDKIFAAIKKIVGLLRRAIKSLDAIEDFIRKTAQGIRNNPAGRGVWKIVFSIAALILEGIAAVVGGISSLLKAILNATKGGLMKQLEALMLKIFGLLGAFGRLTALFRKRLAQLIALCELLEKQQRKIESQNKNLRKSVNKNLLKPIEALLKKLDPITKSILGLISGLEKELVKLTAIAKLLNGLDRLARALQGAVRNFVNAVNRLFKRIQNFIAKIPFIGWLLNILDKIIAWVIKKLRIKQALNALAKGIKNLPFIRRLLDFAAQIKALLKAIIDKMAELEKQLKAAMDNIKAMLKLVEKLIEDFSKLGVSKLKLEVNLSINVGAMNEFLDEAASFAELDDKAGFERALGEYDSLLWQTHAMLLDGPYALFGATVHQAFDDYAGLVSQLFSETIDNAAWEPTQTEMLSFISSLRGFGEPLQSTIDAFTAAGAYSDEYYAALAAALEHIKSVDVSPELV